jgi:4,5-dihydroxyphthalate decarboxylase
MPPLPMTFACGLYDRMTALHTGEVRPAGIDLNFIAVHHPRELFDRMVARQEFDASEMSASEYVTRFAAGKCPFVALPAFPSRMFRHGFIAVDSRVIGTPKDLQGKRIGVQLYTMTAAVWIRGLLQHDHGVDSRPSSGWKARWKTRGRTAIRRSCLRSSRCRSSPIPAADP